MKLKDIELWFKRRKHNPYHDKLGRFARADEPSTHNFVSTSGVFAGQKNAGTSGAASTLNYHDTNDFTGTVVDDVVTEDISTQSSSLPITEDISPLPNSLTTTETEALKGYTDNKYAATNRYLGTGNFPNFAEEGEKKSIIKDIEHIDSALSKAKLPSNITVERITNGGRILRELGVKDYSKSVGKLYTDKAYSSTSTRLTSKGHNSAEGGIEHSSSIKLRIKVPKGSNALNIAKISAHKEEKEILIHRNATYKIRAYDRENNILHVDLLSAGSDL